MQSKKYVARRFAALFSLSLAGALKFNNRRKRRVRRAHVGEQDALGDGAVLLVAVAVGKHDRLVWQMDVRRKESNEQRRAAVARDSCRGKHRERRSSVAKRSARRHFHASIIYIVCVRALFSHTVTTTTKRLV